MKIPFKFDRKVLWISLLVVVLFVIMLFIAQNLYGIFTTDEPITSAVATSNPQSESGQLGGQSQGFDQSKTGADLDATSSSKEGDAKPSLQSEASNKKEKDSISVGGSQSTLSRTESSDQPDESLIAELEKLRDPFQKTFKKDAGSTANLVQDVAMAVKQTQSSTASKAHEPLVDNQTTIDMHDTDVIYQELYETVKGATTEPEMVKEPVEYPSIMLKGVVLQGGVKKKAILTTSDQSYIVGVGQEIGEWKITKIEQNHVRVENQEQEGFILTLEGVSVDESSQ